MQKSGLQPGVSPVSRSPRTGLASRGQGQGVQVKDRPNEKKQGGQFSNTGMEDDMSASSSTDSLILPAG